MPISVSAAASPAAAAGGPIEDRANVTLSPVAKSVATIVLMAATILVVLDQTIANVALPHMQAALGATPDTITWVLTSYIMATAVGTPLTGWLSSRFGRTRFFLVCVIGFTLSSMLCGLAVSLPMMVASRIAQGFFGAFLMPMSQAFLYDINPPSQQVRAVTMWGIGSMLGPIIGPVIGGWLTDALNWRWVFFINVPIGAVAVFGLVFTMPKFPSERRGFDHIGFALIALGLCSLQLALDRGTQLDWFESTEILIELGVSLAAFWMLIFHLRRAAQPIIPMGLFANRNFSATMALVFILMPTILAANALLPTLLVNLMGYPVSTAGEMLIPRGISLTVAIYVGGFTIKRMDGRIQIALGALMVVWSLALQTNFNLAMDADVVLIAGLLQGFGVGFAMTVLNFNAISSAPATMRTEAAAVYALFRNTGASIMLAVFTALLAHNVQVNHAELGARLAPGSAPMMLTQILGGIAPGREVAEIAEAEVSRQAMMIAYVDDYWAMMWTVLIALPLILLLRPIRAPRAGGPSTAGHAE